MTALCTELYQNFRSESWNEFDLGKLPGNELRFLCRMAGFAHTGTKEKLILRLLSCRIVRMELAGFPDDAFMVAAAFKRSRLHWMCTQANLWKSGPKVSLAAVLLKWRNECRFNGKKYFEACLAETKARGYQPQLAL